MALHVDPAVVVAADAAITVVDRSASDVTPTRDRRKHLAHYISPQGMTLADTNRPPKRVVPARVRTDGPTS